MAITTRAAFFNRRGLGKGLYLPMPIVDSNTTTTAAVAASGFQTFRIMASAIGSTFPSSFQQLPLPPALSTNLNLGLAACTLSAARTVWLAYFYKLGTLDLTGTGNKFTHDAATFPVLRKQFGQASQPLTLMPLVIVTTALTTTAATFLIRNHTGPAAGYTNQDGTSVTGTQLFTFPSATTTLNSGFVPILELTGGGGATFGDSGVQDISNIDIQTSASVGACDIWGVEYLSPLANSSLNQFAFNDAIMSGFNPVDLAPAVATSGTAVSRLALLALGSVAASGTLVIEGALNT